MLNQPKLLQLWQDVLCRLAIVPARGKSYISKKIYRYLNWLGFKTEVYNVGNYRRKYMSDNNMELTTDFFDNSIPKYKQIRQYVAQKALEDLINFINKPQNTVAIFDATNTTKNRRNLIATKLKQSVKEKYQLIFLESICDNQCVVEDNIKKVKVHGLDFQGQDQQIALEEFKRRIDIYTKDYQSLTKEETFSYLKTINVGEGFQVHKICGFLSQKIMNYTMNLTISPNREIYMSMHGQSFYSLEDRIGGNCGLSENGMKFAKALPNVMKQLMADEYEYENLRVITSTLLRTQQTAEHLQINKFPVIPLKLLDELNAGICQNLTYDQIKKKYPQIAAERNKKKLTFRYPSGQSYLDLIGRLQPVICWIERQKYSVFVISHQAVIRCIFSYFFNIDLNLMLYENVPLHNIIRLTPETYTFREEYVEVNIQKQCISKITRPPRKKHSIDHDGSNNPIISKQMMGI